MLIRRLGTGLSVALVLLVTVGRMIVEPVTVSSASMQPAFQPGDRVVIDKVSFRFREAHRGEVVVLDDPHGDGPLIKRVVGIGGDEIGIENGVLLVNGTAIHLGGTASASSGSAGSGSAGSGVVGDFFGPVTVPLGQVFVLGDNRSASDDSREFGPVSDVALIGRVLA